MTAAAEQPRLAELIRTAATTANHIPLPGSGDTAARHHSLAEFGRTDLSLGRIMEAHSDAIAILAAAGREPRRDAIYGVWASESPHSVLTAHRTPEREWQLDGKKRYCSGATFVSAALVTARVDDAVGLLDVAMSERGIQVEASDWASPAFADTDTRAVSFTAVKASPASLIGGKNWYLDRPGFWHGAIGPAACWAGGALSLLDAANKLPRRDAHTRAHLGAMRATAWSMATILEKAGQEIDADPYDAGGAARVRALQVRHLIERSCMEIMERFGRATGPQLLAYDRHVARQYGALTLYLRQSHAERDLESIA
jgi:alkylation response protein AidB-like acyl-CoA dehydrogenase